MAFRHDRLARYINSANMFVCPPFRNHLLSFVRDSVGVITKPFSCNRGQVEPELISVAATSIPAKLMVLLDKLASDMVVQFELS